MANARTSRSDNSLKFFMARLDYQCIGLVQTRFSSFKVYYK